MSYPKLSEPRIPWPNGVRCPVILNFHPDGESLLLASDPANSNRRGGQLMYTYGPRVGMQRILRMLDEYSLPASFYMPAVQALRHPYMVDWILESGRHEVGCHGYTHEWVSPETDEATEADLLDKQVEVMSKAIGKPVRGFISTGWEFTPNTLRLLMERGFEFSGDWLGEDVPYYLRDGENQTDFVAMPVNWTLDDAPLYWFNLQPYLNYGSPYAEPSKVLELWKSEFDALYEEGAVFHLTMHPFLSGRGARLKTLERFIQYAMGHPGVEFFTMEQVADMYRTVVSVEQGQPGAWYPTRGDQAPRATPIDGVPIYY